MTFFSLIIRNVWSKKARSIGLAFAVAFAVMTVVTLAVTSSGLEQSAASIISVGKADFTVAQKGASDLLASTIDEQELGRLRHTPGVASAVGVLVEIQHINADNPVFIEIGINPGDLAAFGVTVVAGHAYPATAAHAVMLGWRAAANLGLRVGDRFNANGTWNTVTGIFSTGNAYGDAGAMFPLPAVQGYNRVPGIVTLAFVKISPGATVAAVTRRVDYDLPELTTISTASQFGRADRSLIYLQAAVNGSTVLAILIGAVISRQHNALVVVRAHSRIRTSSGDRLDPSPDGRALTGRKLASRPLRGAIRRRPLLRSHDGPGEPSGAQRRSTPEFHPRRLLESSLHSARDDSYRRVVPDDPGSPALTPEGAQL